MKKIIVISLWLIIYVRGLIHGYFSPMRGGWMFATALLYIFMHYVTLSWRDMAHKYGWIVWTIFGVLVFSILAITKNIWIGLSALLRHAAIRSVLHSLEAVLTNRRTFSPVEFFQSGWALFSIFFTLSFITAFIGRNQQFDLTCQDIYKASNAVINYTEEKFNIGYHQIQQRQRNILGNMIDTAVPTPQLTGDQDSISNEAYQELLTTLSGYDLSNYDITGYINSAQQQVQQADDEIGFSAMLQTYKQQLIDETIANQKDVNQKVCQVFIDQIKDMYEKPGFRVSVILLMFLVLSPLLRITLYIVSGVNMLIFYLLRKANVYTIKKESVEVDTVE